MFFRKSYYLPLYGVIAFTASLGTISPVYAQAGSAAGNSIPATSRLSYDQLKTLFTSTTPLKWCDRSNNHLQSNALAGLALLDNTQKIALFRLASLRISDEISKFIDGPLNSDDSKCKDSLEYSIALFILAKDFGEAIKIPELNNSSMALQNHVTESLQNGKRQAEIALQPVVQRLEPSIATNWLSLSDIKREDWLKKHWGLFTEEERKAYIKDGIKNCVLYLTDSKMNVTVTFALKDIGSALAYTRYVTKYQREIVFRNDLINLTYTNLFECTFPRINNDIAHESGHVYQNYLADLFAEDFKGSKLSAALLPAAQLYIIGNQLNRPYVRIRNYLTALRKRSPQTALDNAGAIDAANQNLSAFKNKLLPAETKSGAGSYLWADWSEFLAQPVSLSPPTLKQSFIFGP